MLHQIVTRVSFDSIREKSRGKKIILLYPWRNYRNLFLSHFLNRKEGLLYYRVSSDEAPLTTWLGDLVRELDAVLGGFGQQTRQILQSGTSVEIGEAFAADLINFATEHIIFFIDELDRIEFDDEFKKFIYAVVDKLPEHIQLAFSARIVTASPWTELVSQGKVAILGTEHRKNDVIFTLEEKPKPQIEVYALGRGYVLVNGQQITNWDGALPRNLFFFFMDRPLVTRDEIFELFWPNLSVKEATNVFHVTKRKISERINMKVEDGNNYELTQYASGFYMPSDKVVRHYDVTDFQEALEQAVISTDERKEESLYLRAIDLYKGHFLNTINMPWAMDRKEHLRSMFAQALVGVGRIAARRDDHERALGFFLRSIKEMPEREDVHREVMRNFMHMGMYQDARVHYEKFQEYLSATVGIQPSLETRDLYGQILTKI